jgi:hypothetical protein
MSVYRLKFIRFELRRKGKGEETDTETNKARWGIKVRVSQYSHAATSDKIWH